MASPRTTPIATPKSAASRAIRRLMSAAILLGSTTLLASCNIVAPIAMIVEGPPKFQAQFTLDKDRPTLILVDDNLNILPRPRLKQVMATRAQEVLLKEGVLKKVIDSGSAYAVTARDRDGQVLSLTQVAKAVGAEVIVSVTIDSFGGTVESNDMVLQTNFRVRVLDATNEKEPRLWPTPTVAEGAGGIARYRLPAAGKIETNSEAFAAQNALAEQTGKAIAQFFFEHLKTDSAAAGK